MTLEELRLHLDTLDQRLLELIAERQATSREIARVKRATGHATRDYARERDVILAVRAGAAQRGVPADAAEAVMRVLIRPPHHQEQASVVAQGAGSASAHW
jgi:chorismate mutase